VAAPEMTTSQGRRREASHGRRKGRHAQAARLAAARAGGGVLSVAVPGRRPAAAALKSRQPGRQLGGRVPVA
jgi:hypothetical protein